MIAFLGIGLMGMLLASANPPDISGDWSGADWGRVVLKKTNDAEYTGSYSETVGKQPGEIQLKWSRIERRFNGAWREGEERFGDLSIRLAGDEIRGALTTDPRSKINPATPRLADLTWTRAQDQKHSIGPVTNGVQREQDLTVVAEIRIIEVTAASPLDMTKLDLSTIEKKAGVSILAAPRILARSGQECEVNVGGEGSNAFSPTPSGVTVRLLPTLDGETVHYKAKLSTRARQKPHAGDRTTIRELAYAGDAQLGRPVLVDIGKGEKDHRFLAWMVFQRVTRKVDNIDLPFVNDPDVLGEWTSVDFVASSAEFNPDKTNWKDALDLKGLTFLPGGKTPWPWWTWTKGVLIHHGDKTASHYEVKEIEGQRYMFLEWKSGDVTISGLKPKYYVLRWSGIVNDVEGKASSAIVEEAVKTISTCAEGDRRVAEAIASLKGLKEAEAVAELGKFLGSQEATIRRAAIFILWQGKFASIKPAVAGLLKQCENAEDLTRGMAALALGGNRVAGSLPVLMKMTSDDKSGYARRCAAIALGFLGDRAATGVLEKAIQDPEAMVRANAQAALMMLRRKGAQIAPSTTKAPVAARLDFRIAATRDDGKSDLSEADIAEYQKHEKPAARNTGRPLDWFEMRAKGPTNLIEWDYSGCRHVLLSKTPDGTMLDVGSWGLKRVAADKDPRGKPVIEVEFNEAGRRKMEALSRANLHRPLAILINDVVASAPVLQSYISDRAQIVGDFAAADVKQLVAQLQASISVAKAEMATPTARSSLLSEQPPVVVETCPVSGARDVAAGEREIRVRFSKPMTDASWSWSTAWENSTPEFVGPPHYEPDGRTCVARVKLEAGRTYAFWLNSEKFQKFQGRDGRPAVPYLLSFQTQAKPGSNEK